MFEIKETGFAEECVNCKGCGCHSHSIKSILIYPTMTVKGRETRIGGRIVELRLCSKCRKEMGNLLMGK